MSAQESADPHSPSCAAHRSTRRLRLRQPVFDALGAALLFAILTAVGTSAPVKASPFSAAFSGIERTLPRQTIKAIAEPGPAPIIQIATTSSPFSPDAVFRRTSSSAAWGLWGLSLSLLTALNLSFFRHLRRVYVAPRSRRKIAQLRYPQRADSNAIESPHSRL